MIEIVEDVFYKDEKKVLNSIIKQAGNNMLMMAPEPSSIKCEPINIYKDNLTGIIPTNYQEVNNEVEQLKRDFSELMENLKAEISQLEKNLQVQEQQTQILQP